MKSLEAQYREWSKVYHLLPPEHQKIAAAVGGGKPARLARELQPYVYDDPDSPFGPVLKHPLVFAVPYTARDNRRLNHQLKWKRECLDRYMADRNWSGWCAAHERPYRLDALAELVYDVGISPGEFWATAGWVWTDSENIWQNEDEWRDLFAEFHDTDRHLFMRPEDIEEWALLPDEEPIPVFRGFSVEGREFGMSWTTDQIRAKWFARRFANDGRARSEARIAYGTVMKADAVGYHNARTESEVVVLPENVADMRVLTLDDFQQTRKEATSC